MANIIDEIKVTAKVIYALSVALLELNRSLLDFIHNA